MHKGEKAKNDFLKFAQCFNRKKLRYMPYTVLLQKKILKGHQKEKRILKSCRRIEKTAAAFKKFFAPYKCPLKKT